MRVKKINENIINIYVSDIYHILTNNKIYSKSVVIKATDKGNWKEITNDEMIHQQLR